ncbi:type VII secretion protein [Bacillus wiedmannii]|uniref:WXG100 family type VII secretion target n=1 Tax=Bacillus wiedmannii TaxID=1890302 RepID=UPI000BF12BE0|nr:WXG100 family type VII secretion target [Bacillus wiedmannii]MCU5497806.1 WXG100 family type VII secretion target [Bacillus wiedmannii]MED2881373.1 WXG100 family type VII secretion target [Bacillus wiedmannii]PEL99207.1 type VII secretion protein [Bacillus wiedmannii]PEP33343.1 type VII secretion protein [Bacillus wiedmannii]PFZ06864.1 type VII secretion protein [Bacillus wiedmannii]
MVQIKVTPERLEQAAKTVKDVRYTLEQIHNDLYNQTEHIAATWIGATSQHFYQMFNEAKPKMFTVLMEFDKIADELERAAEKFRTADAEYDGNLVEGETAASASSSKKGDDSLEKAARDLAGELSGEYDVRRVMEGVDPDTGEKLSWWDRTGAGVMVFAGLTPLGKGIKVVKGAKKVADAVDTAKKIDKTAEAVKAQRQVQIGINQATGRAFEKEVYKDFSKEVDTVVEQITLKTNKTGTKTRLDFLGANKDLEDIRIVEAKGSPTAPLTKKQKIAIPEIEEHGATVVGKGKPPFVGGTEIPPTKVEIRRKQ